MQPVLCLGAILFGALHLASQESLAFITWPSGAKLADLINQQLQREREIEIDRDRDR
jgi:hypothetical protein